MCRIFLVNWTKILLIFILIIGFGLRIWNIQTNPPELFSDEIVNFTSAKNVIETGKDLEGNSLIYFSDRIEPHPPIYGYVTYLFSRFIKDPILVIRLPAVLFGTITILLIYILSFELTANKIISLISAFLSAILPWTIHFSRIGWGPAVFLPLFLLAIIFLIKSLNRKKPFFILLGTCFIGLTFFSYYPAFLYSSLMLFFIIITGNKKYLLKNRKIALLSILIYLFAISPFFIIAIEASELFNRAQRISTFATGLNLENIKVFLYNYLQHFNPKFLFINGDSNLLLGAHTGVLYLWMVPFILFGFFSLSRVIKTPSKSGVILFWLIIFPLAGSLTNDGVPHSARTLIGAPVFCLLASIGIWSLIKFIYNNKSYSRLTLGLTIFSILWATSFYMNLFIRQYFFIYPLESQYYWEYGTKQVFGEVKKIEHNYTRICLGNFDPYHSQILLNYYLSGSRLSTIDDINNPLCKKTGSILVWHAKKSLFSNGHLVDTILDLNKQPGYYILTIDETLKTPDL